MTWLANHRIKDDGLPVDLAHQHEHYLYGTPKKPDPMKRRRKKPSTSKQPAKE